MELVIESFANIFAFFLVIVVHTFRAEFLFTSAVECGWVQKRHKLLQNATFASGLFIENANDNAFR
jgi:hypothetical protein